MDDKPKLVYSGASEHHDITVEQRGRFLEMRFSGRSQGSLDLETGIRGGAPVLEYMHLPFALVPEPRRALVIGLGGGVLPRQILAWYPETRVDVVEVDPEVVRICRTYFELPEDERLDVIVGEGRAFLESTERCYDVVVVDAFFVTSTAGCAVPFQLATREFFDLLRCRMSDEGVLAFNVSGVQRGRGSGPLRGLCQGIRRSFPSMHLFVVRASRSQADRRKNYVVIATNHPMTAQEVRSRILAQGPDRVPIEGFEHCANDLIQRPFDWRGAREHRDRDAPPDGLMRG